MAYRCIDSWKKYLPEYEIHLWNENNFDVKNSVTYVMEAYEAKKFAFVADYVRLFALYSKGGIYLDIDVEVLKSFNDLLELNAFSGFENEVEITTGIIASKKKGAWVKEQLEYYSNRSFKLSDGTLDMTTNVEFISEKMAKDGFKLNNTYQVYNNLHVFPEDYFCPKSNTGKISITKNTYCIHHFYGSWQPTKVKLKKIIFHKILGSKITNTLVNLKHSILRKVSAKRNFII